MPSKAIEDAYAYFAELRRKRASGPPPSLAEMRARFLPGGKAFPLPNDVAVASITMGGCPAYWLVAPGVRTDCVILFLHGGGYTIGSIESHGEIAARIGREAKARVLFLEYPLVPEHPFPAAVDATLAAWRALLETEKLEASSLAVVGDSAGGGLSLAFMIALRDAGEALPASAALVSPLTDLTVSGSSIEERAEREPIFRRAALEKLAKDYLAGADPKNPLASPHFASLAKLPPLLVQVGSEEMLFSDAERLVENARRDGVEAVLEIGEGLPHVYQQIADAEEARSATARIGDFLCRNW